jgi:hypothetical protein
VRPTVSLSSLVGQFFAPHGTRGATVESLNAVRNPEKVRLRGTRKPARETRALPGSPRSPEKEKCNRDEVRFGETPKSEPDRHNTRDACAPGGRCKTGRKFLFPVFRREISEDLLLCWQACRLQMVRLAADMAASTVSARGRRRFFRSAGRRAAGRTKATV